MNAEAAELDLAVAVLAAARRVVVLTGAGMSQDSGVPTFRDALTGLWTQYDPQQLATEVAFRRDPAAVFGWYIMRWRRIHEVEPHAGYHALVDLARCYDDLLIATQNVDALHQRAGCDHVVELHGRLDAFRCLDGGHPFDPGQIASFRLMPDAPVDPPRCPQCSSPIRPGVVWFGESLPEHALDAAWCAVESCDALLVVGTSAVVYPAAELPQLALARQTPVVDVNPERTPVSGHATAWLPDRAATALPVLATRILAARAAGRI